MELLAGNLAYDLIFTVILSLMMVGRKSLREMSSSLVLPVALAIISLIIAQNFDTERLGAKLNELNMTGDESGYKAFESRESYI